MRRENAKKNFQCKSQLSEMNNADLLAWEMMMLDILKEYQPMATQEEIMKSQRPNLEMVWWVKNRQGNIPVR